MRLVTRSDFDGLVCAVLLTEAGVVEDYLFVHPKEVQDGNVPVSKNDILANVPYAPGCGMWFDHHLSEQERSAFPHRFEGESRRAKSAARVIYDYYGGRERFPRFDDMMAAVDKVDSGELAVEEVLVPQGWILLSFIVDQRTGLGRFQGYRIGNLEFAHKLIDLCRTCSLEQIMACPDVQERVQRYFEQEDLYIAMLRRHSTRMGNLLLIDLREVDEPHTGNRFLEYCLNPNQNISIRVMWGVNRQKVVFAVGHSTINRTSKVNVGSLMLRHGGGGHFQVGTCQVPVEQSEAVLAELIEAVREDDQETQPQPFL